jgi:hypothetical protein
MHSKKRSDIKEVYQLSNNENLPSRKSGRKPSISISGTLSNTVIHPTKNCRTQGFRTFIRSLNNGMNSSMLRKTEHRKAVHKLF